MLTVNGSPIRFNLLRLFSEPSVEKKQSLCEGVWGDKPRIVTNAKSAENCRRGDQPSVCRVLVNGDSITGHCLANSHKKILVGLLLICCADVHSVDVSYADGSVL